MIDNADSDSENAVKPTKKAKVAPVDRADGKDAEGNPFWEVIYSQVPERMAQLTQVFADLQEPKGDAIRLQEPEAHKHPRVLRERRQRAAREEGAAYSLIIAPYRRI
jgi:hypothetical protein